MFEPELFRKQMYRNEESTFDIVGTFRSPAQSFGAPAVIWRRGIVSRLTPIDTPLCV